MTGPEKLPPIDEQLWSLTEAMCDGTIAPENLERLESLLRADENARLFYAGYMDLHGRICWRFRGTEPKASRDEVLEQPFGEPSATPCSAPVSGFFGSAWHGTLSYFSDGWPLAYLIGTVIFGIGLTIASLMIVTHHVQVATRPSTPVFAPHKTDLAIQYVGRISAMQNCRGEGYGVRGEWKAGNGTNQNYGPVGNKSLIALGDKYALSSGLLEITYDTGATVILQGPCTYEVDSRDGGFLSLGRLTARLEKRGESRGERGEPVVSGQWPVVSKEGAEEVASGQWLVASESGGKSRNPEIPKSPASSSQPALTLALSQRERGPDTNPQSLIPNPSLSTSHYPLFTIKTPTATVTDLGTEFAVEVTKTGDTTSHVFRGSVRVQMISTDGRTEGIAQVLHANQSARIEINADNPNAEKHLSVFATPAQLTEFVREIAHGTTSATVMKSFDLVDAFAGGDGFSGRHGSGIDPLSGQAVDALPLPRELQYASDSKYHHPIISRPFVDGVFIPNGNNGPIQVDSAGHTFAEFPTTNNMTACFFLAGGEIQLDQSYLEMTKLGEIDYALPGHGLLFVHPNKGITFNLNAVRKAVPGCAIKRFLTTTGNSGFGAADLWILIDGQERFSRREINNNHVAMPVTIPIQEGDRFLTLAGTDGGDGIGGDWIIFGDPRLELACPVGNVSPDRKGGSDTKK